LFEQIKNEKGSQHILFEQDEGFKHPMYSVQFLYCGRSVVFSQGTPVSSTNKADCHDITEILLKVALNTIKQTYDLTSSKYGIFAQINDNMNQLQNYVFGEFQDCCRQENNPVWKHV